MKDKYICNDDGILEQFYEIRKMSDEEFKKYIEELKNKEKEEK